LPISTVGVNDWIETHVANIFVFVVDGHKGLQVLLGLKFLKQEVELLLVVLLDPIDTSIALKILAVGLLQVLVESKTLHLVGRLLCDIIKHLLSVLINVRVGPTHSRLVGVLGALSYSNINVALNLGAFNARNAKYKFHQLGHDFRWARHQVFIPHNVDWNVLLHPEVVKVTPDSDLILDPLFPLQRVGLEVAILNGAIVGACGVHVKQTDYAIERTSQ
jgi:hypothetical protein